MPRFIKTLMLWLLLAALPLQGMAAATRMSCAPAPHAAMAAQAHQAHQAAHAQHATPAADDHADHAGHAAGAGHDRHAAAQDTAPDQHHHASACSHCAACAFGAAAPPPAPATVHAGAGPDLPFPAAPRGTAGFIPPGLERPPRA